ncbi:MULTISPECIES: hypothetical protein [unclassified Bradyrhizobium]|uniref:hypothetical protein n=1 Tax=unclassified Bradyrhizobium TaxID=2631580 RepID=UPI002478821C|nr:MULTISPECIES: hypothetical protein [unclassified Bradyrhizobium]WGR68592.1 hypothetical protein MTX24_24525 [Bradyrhizobium sp. ISRA426]WGR80647.1 hypothetical protein MTX21_09640 [Bradyrhizobium sp. ISRA430]WGR83832.1 hypothetical protein MTX25_24205 [Bradyrhizobium sp. ISRA432]
MSRGWFIIWALIVCQVAAWAFAPQHTVQRPTAIDGPGYGSDEVYLVKGRASQRSEAALAFERPYGARCAGDGRKQFISAINEYYYHRQNQMERYPEIFGQPGADYIAKQWSTGDDHRIERLTREAYAQGYLELSDFDGVARKLVQAVVRNERITAHSCAS